MIDNLIDSFEEYFKAKKELERLKESYQGDDFYYFYSKDIDYVDGLKLKVESSFKDAVKDVCFELIKTE